MRVQPNQYEHECSECGDSFVGGRFAIRCPACVTANPPQPAAPPARGAGGKRSVKNHRNKKTASKRRPGQARPPAPNVAPSIPQPPFGARDLERLDGWSEYLEVTINNLTRLQEGIREMVTKAQ